MGRQSTIKVSQCLFALTKRNFSGLSYGMTNEELIDDLKRIRLIKSEKVENVMKSVDRGDFVQEIQYAYENDYQLIGYGASISSPNAHAYALEMFKDHLKDGAKVLDIGSGSGYLTACFAVMAGPNAKVIGLDHIQELVDWSEKNIRKNNSTLIDSGRIKLVVGDGHFGFEEDGPYHVIHVGAADSGIPQSLVDQLAPDGRLIIPVMNHINGGQNLELIDRTSDGKIKRQILTSVDMAPLTDIENQLKSTFVLSSLSQKISRLQKLPVRIVKSLLSKKK